MRAFFTFLMWLVVAEHSPGLAVIVAIVWLFTSPCKRKG